MNSKDRPVALVTGAATGVGRACVLQFAARGFDVIVNYSRSADEAAETVLKAKSLNAKVLLRQCDVSDDASVQQMIGKIKDQFGRLDVVVNNAATTSFIEHADLDAMTEELWDRILAVNVKGAFFVTRAATSLLKEGDGGAVVNISSVAGITGSGSSVAYCASKAALNTMTKSLARALAPEIRVNAVCPGPIESRWIREGNPGTRIEDMVADYPLPKASMPDDIADAVVFFALGTSMATGQLLSDAGGQTLG